MKRNYAGVYIGFMTVILALVFVAFWIAPRPAHSESWALVVLLARDKAESWQVPTKGDDHAIPTAGGCAVAANTLLPLWVRDHMPGWDIAAWWCVPDGEAEKFIAANRGERV